MPPEWETENPKDHWRERVHTLEHKGTLYVLEYLHKGVDKNGWWLFLDDEEELGEPMSLILELAKQKVEERLR